eukprot:1193723-Pleurochrysis_carterae.AAC.2
MVVLPWDGPFLRLSLGDDGAHVHVDGNEGAQVEGVNVHLGIADFGGMYRGRADGPEELAQSEQLVGAQERGVVVEVKLHLRREHLLAEPLRRLVSVA